MFCLGSKQTNPIVVDVSVGGVPVFNGVNTGAAVSVMSQKQQQELFPDAQLQLVNIAWRT